MKTMKVIHPAGVFIYGLGGFQQGAMFEADDSLAQDLVDSNPGRFQVIETPKSKGAYGPDKHKHEVMNDGTA